VWGDGGYADILDDRRPVQAIEDVDGADDDAEMRRSHQKQAQPTAGTEEKNFFFEKKKQKTFMFLDGCLLQHAPQDAKVFWFFFSKKNALAEMSRQHGEARQKSRRARGAENPAQDQSHV